MDNQNLNLKNLDLSLLDTLSPAEKELALSILQEYAEKGESSSLNDILLEDYAEPPVDILTFVDDYKYLGNAWHDAQGNSKLYPYWRKELVKIFPDNLTTSVNNAIFSGSRGRGKEQPISSLVLSDKGFIRMGDVTLDTKVFGCDGKLHPVTGIYPQGVKDVYEITFSDGTTARCGLEHLWKVVDMDHMELHKNAPKEEVLTTECLLNRSLLSGRNRKFRYKIPMCKPIKFERKDTFISPYLMGCLLGDGCFSGKHYISITSADNLIIDIFKNELLKNNYKLSPKKCKNNKCIDFDILPINRGDKNEYVDEIKKLNLLGTYSDTKFIPDVYLYNDVESRTALLQGLLDTDGGLHKSKQRNGQISYSLEFSTTSAKLRDDVIWLVQSLGGTATYIRRASQYKDKHDIIKKCLDHYRIKIRLPEEIIPFKLDRKLTPYKNTTHIQPYRYIARIEKLDKKEECQCIMVGSEEHLYITDNFIVTHNTEIAVLIAAYLLHRVLCLKDPVAHFHLKPTEKLVFAFMNIKLDLAEEIGIAKFQNTIQSSPWFLERGTLEGRTKKIWMPKKFNDQEAIDIKIGSQADDLIGLPIYFCLDGDTEILTSNGVSKIKNLVDKQIKVPTISGDSNIVLSNICSVKQTAESNIEYEIKLEDNTIIKCTPNHRFRLVDGSYKEAQNLNEDDDILSFTILNRWNNKKEILKIKSIKVNYLEKPKQYYDVINADPYNNFFIKTNSAYICSHNCFFDEVSFQKNKDVEKQKQKANDAIDTAIGGMKTRFVYKGKNPTLLCLASSKRSDKSFLEEHMRKKLKSEKDNVYISDGSVWEVKPKGTYSEETFRIGLGNKFLQSVVIPDEEPSEPYIAKGYKIIEAPIDFKADFIDDIDRALCDFAGISSSSITKYINGASVNQIITDRIKNPFSREILEIGDGPEDDTQYYNFFDINKIDPQLRSKPLFIHLDMSYTGDMTGIAGVFIRGKKHSLGELDQAKDLFYSLAFSVNIKAPKGRHISFEKNRNFIYWLKEKGFNIKGITSDTFQSYDTGETLRAKGYPYSVLSVDRVDSTSRICIPYQYLRSTIYEKRLEIYEDKLLISELIDLERNMDTGKIDHPDGGCFTGDTKVKLVDGRELSFFKLIKEYEEGKINYVYSMNLQSHKIEPKPILKAWKTGENKSLIKLTFDSGECVECTPNHRFLLRNGVYIEAKDMLQGCLLMSLYKQHKIKAIEYLDKKADVYDIEVADNHNFALACGVFVHNCKDIADATCGAIYNASKHAEEFAYDHGEQMEEVLRLNGDTVNDDVKQLTIDLEKELLAMGQKRLRVHPSDADNGTEDYNLYDDIIIL